VSEFRSNAELMQSKQYSVSKTGSYTELAVIHKQRYVYSYK